MGNCGCENNCKKCVCGTEQNGGCYVCCNCGQKVYLEAGQTLPPCPKCSNQTYTKE